MPCCLASLSVATQEVLGITPGGFCGELIKMLICPWCGLCQLRNEMLYRTGDTDARNYGIKAGFPYNHDAIKEAIARARGGGAPQQVMMAPGYGAPAPGYGAPAPGYGAPAYGGGV